MNTLFDDPGFRLERELFTKRLLTEEEKAAIEAEADEVIKELALFGIKRVAGYHLSPFGTSQDSCRLIHATNCSMYSACT